MSKKENPIAVFDSGVGGISVLRQLVRIMPNENYIYYGDSLHAPYGTKTLEEVQRLTCEKAAELFQQGAKGLVVACNTATSAAVRMLREKYPEHPRVLVLATPMTIRNEKLKHLMERYQDQAELIPVSCPGLMDFVERGDLHSKELRKYLTELFYEFQDRQIDGVVLGCTHYPFVETEIREILGDHVRIFDGGEGTAREMRRRLAEADLLNPAEEKGEVLYENSEHSKEKLQLCKALLENQL